MLSTPGPGLVIEPKKKAQIDAVETRLNYLVSDVKQAEEKAADLRKQITQLQKDHVYYSGLHANVQTDLLKSEGELKRTRLETTTLNQTLESKSSELNQREKAIYAKETELKASAKELSEAQRTHAVDVASHEARLVAHNKEKEAVKNVQKQLEEAAKHITWN